ncbi:MAG: hypothetical protein R3B67_07050 [Phycisphaerales bacterium]
MKLTRLCPVAVLVLSGSTLAGPLIPPVGPIASTMRTLQQVEPRMPIGLDTTPGDANSTFKITQPGSYYLTGNIVGVVGKSGIEIAASGVTIDLGGFNLSGNGPSVVTHGINYSVASLNSVTLLNGTISNWAGTASTSAA